MSTLYNDASKVIVQSLPSFFQIDVTGANSKEMRLLFSGGLGSSGATITSASYEFQTNAGSRTVSSGAATAQTAAVPEPATWAMMLLGFAAIGVVMRRRQQVATTFKFA